MNKKTIRYSDLLVAIRIIFVAFFVSILSFNHEIFGLYPGLFIIAFIFFTDTLDGIVARKFDRDSKFGGFSDILGDRIAETALLIPFVYLNIASPLVLIYFVVKNFSIDFVRFKKFYYSSDAPFHQLENKLSTFLVGHRIMRAAYGLSKMLMIFNFYYLIFEVTEDLETSAIVFSVITVVLSLLRSVPVFIEFFLQSVKHPNIA